MNTLRIFIVLALVFVGCDAPHDLGKITMREAVNYDQSDLARFLIEHDLHERTDDHSVMSAALGLDSMMFGDGSDLDCNWDGVNPVLGVSPVATSVNATISQATTYTLTNWQFCANATISSNVAVIAPYPIYVSQLLTLNSNSAIVRNGCKSNANTTPCAGDAGGFLSGMSGSEGTGGGGFRKLMEFDQSSVTVCAASVNSNGAAANGSNGTAPTLTGCGGGAGSSGGQAVSVVSGRSSPHNTVVMTTYGSGDPLVADGYISFLDALNGRADSGATGGGTGSDGSTLIASGGGSAGWVVVHAFDWTGTGDIEARGGAGFTYTTTNFAAGGGGGGGGGVITFVLGTGIVFPTLDVSGGAGAPGTVCPTCNGGLGLHGGQGASGHAGMAYTFHQQ